MDASARRRPAGVGVSTTQDTAPAVLRVHAVALPAWESQRLLADRRWTRTTNRARRRPAGVGVSTRPARPARERHRGCTPSPAGVGVSTRDLDEPRTAVQVHAVALPAGSLNTNRLKDRARNRARRRPAGRGSLNEVPAGKHPALAARRRPAGLGVSPLHPARPAQGTSVHAVDLPASESKGSKSNRQERLADSRIPCTPSPCRRGVSTRAASSRLRQRERAPRRPAPPWERSQPPRRRQTARSADRTPSPCRRGVSRLAPVIRVSRTAVTRRPAAGWESQPLVRSVGDSPGRARRRPAGVGVSTASTKSARSR